MYEKDIILFSMKAITLFYIFTLVVAIAVAEEKYEEIGDNFDVTELLQNDRLLKSYTACLLSKGPCTPEVKKVKDKLPEALETKCSKCTEKQKQIGKQLTQEIKKKYPQLWEQLIAKYDPEGKYQKAYEDILNSP